MPASRIPTPSKQLPCQGRFYVHLASFCFVFVRECVSINDVAGPCDRQEQQGLDKLKDTTRAPVLHLATRDWFGVAATVKVTSFR